LFFNFGHKLHHEKTQLQRRTLYFTARSFEKSAQAILDFNDSGLSILKYRIEVKILLCLWMKREALELLGLEGKGYQALFIWWS
jgi:hypothetical protein